MEEFYLGTILSVTTGVLFVEMEQIYDILDYMTGEKLFTHQLPRVARECTSHLIDQLPWLAEIDTSNVPHGDGCQGWLGDQIDKYGVSFEIASLPQGVHTAIDPIEEISQMMGY